jgi:hypothetical protein
MQFHLPKITDLDVQFGDLLIHFLAGRRFTVEGERRRLLVGKERPANGEVTLAGFAFELDLSVAAVVLVFDEGRHLVGTTENLVHQISLEVCDFWPGETYIHLEGS